MDEEVLTYETPNSVLVGRIMALARRDGPNLYVIGASTANGVLTVIVGDQEAADAVRGMAPDAIVTIID